MSAIASLTTYVAKTTHLHWLEAISKWDEAVMMPTKGGFSRGQSLATLSGMIHQRSVSTELAELIAAAKQEDITDPWQQRNIALIEKTYHKAACLDQDLVEAATQATITAEQAWRSYRADNDWQSFKPILEQSFILHKQIIQAHAELLNLSLMDSALDQYNSGITTSIIDPLFTTLSQELPDLLTQALAKQQQTTLIRPNGPFPINQQEQLAKQAMQLLQFDFDHGRLDTSHHPFCGGTPDDVRITTRYDERDFIQAIMGVCHETGHAKYEQQLPTNWREQPVGQSHNMAIHESQSLFIEMQICRTPEFMQAFAPIVNKVFGNDAAYQPDNLYKLYTEVNPGYIRVDADEVSYPLHVVMRYEMEKSLFDGSISIADLPDVWHQYMQKFFGLSTLGQDDIGVMQDVHWPCGAFGYFPAYTLGSLLAAQIKQRMQEELPNLAACLTSGNLQPIFQWLGQRIHSQGQLRDFSETVLYAVGQPLNTHAFLTHIRNKYL